MCWQGNGQIGPSRESLIYVLLPSVTEIKLDLHKVLSCRKMVELLFLLPILLRLEVKSKEV